MDLDSVSSMKRKARREASHGEYNLWGGPTTRRTTTDSEMGRRNSTRSARMASPDVEEHIEHVHHSQSMPTPSPSAYNSSVDQSQANGTAATRRITTEKPIAEDPESSQPSPLRPNAENPEILRAETSASNNGPKTRKDRWRKLFLDDPVPWQQQIRSTLFPRWLTINWLLLFVPIGIGLHFAKVNALAIFIINFVAIIPLAAILSFATEEIALRVGEVLGGLLNASFGYVI
jgi:hypothetical protein